jgi:hypothetical protein
MSAPEIKLSCPFCGAMDGELQVMELDDGCGNAVVCDCCGCIGPQDARREEAVALWNGAAVNALRRSAPAPEEFAQLMEASNATR